MTPSPDPIQRDCPTEDATRRLGLDLAAVLRPGDAVELRGPLGAGKTTLVRAIAEGLGLGTDAVSSPTFVIVHEYTPQNRHEADDDDGPHRPIPTLVHADFYRLGELDELDALGWDRLAGPEAGTIVVAEWPERAPGALDAQPGGIARLTLEPTGETSRTITIETPAAWHERAAFDALRPRSPTTCPVTGRPVPADSPTWPFADEKARLADLDRWFTEQYTVSREIRDTDLELGD